MENQKYDVLLRLTVAALLLLAALLLRFDTQTKVIYFGIAKRATYKDLGCLFDLMWIDLAAATYNVLHILRYFFFPMKQDSGTFYRSLAWACYLVDQAVVYLVFAANSAASSGSFLAITGASAFQWMKLCNKFTRFCYQIGGALFCGLVASIVLIMVTSLSAYRLFRLYSPKQFQQLKKNHYTFCN